MKMAKSKKILKSKVNPKYSLDQKQLEEFGKKIVDQLNLEVYPYLEQSLKSNRNIRKTLNPAFPFPKEIRIGFLDKCLIVEQIGPEDILSESIPSTLIWRPEFDMFDFLSIDLKHLNPIKFNLDGPIENVSFFLGESAIFLCDYFYDFLQNPKDLIFESVIDLTGVKAPTYMSNVTFFWTDLNGHLKIRHIDFMEIFPVMEGGWGYHDSESIKRLRNFLLNYKVPNYSVELHKVLNEFIELINKSETNEPEITLYLENNPEILKLAFGARKLNPQVLLEWQYEKHADNLQPDFLVERMDGYCDILEFKLPHLKSKPVVGKKSRKMPSSEIDEAIAQVDLYKEWCEQEVNAQWLESNKGIKVKAPHQIIVIGHSKDFSAEDRRAFKQVRNASIFTYDEFIDLVRYHLYNFR